MFGCNLKDVRIYNKEKMKAKEIINVFLDFPLDIEVRVITKENREIKLGSIHYNRVHNKIDIIELGHKEK